MHFSNKLQLLLYDALEHQKFSVTTLDWMDDLNIINENYWTERRRETGRERDSPLFERVSLSTEKPNEQLSGSTEHVKSDK